MPCIAAVKDTWSRKSRESPVNWRRIDNMWNIVSRAASMFVMTGKNSSEAEEGLVKGIVDSAAYDNTV